MVGDLRLVGRADSQQLAADRVPDATAAGPAGQDVIEAAVGIQAYGGERVAVGPGIARGAVPGYLPAVIEHHAGSGGCCAAGEHPDLIGVRTCVEVAADHDRIAPGSGLLHELDQLPDLALADGTAVQRVVEHGREQL